MWALATGAITGGIWVATILFGHLRKQAVQQPILLAQLEDRLERLGHVEKRLAEVEGRLEFAERLLAATPDTPRQRLPPPEPPR
jgi:hypothetical protein